MPGVVTVARKETTSRKDEPPVKLKPTSSKSNLQTAPALPSSEPEVKDPLTTDTPVSFGQLTGDLIALFQKHEFLQETSLVNGGHKPKTSAGGDDRDEFIVKFDSLIKRVAWSKRQNNSILLSFFNQTNVRILQFYEMLATILNVCASWAELMTTNSGHHQVFLAKTLEFLHLLIF